MPIGEFALDHPQQEPPQERERACPRCDGKGKTLDLTPMTVSVVECPLCAGDGVEPPDLADCYLCGLSAVTNDICTECGAEAR